MKLPVFVPVEQHDPCLGIAHGSAIIGTPLFNAEEDMVHVYYEGNLYDACNLQRFEDKALVAAFRAIDRAPTIAHRVFARDELLLVAYFDTEQKQLVEIMNATALALWSGKRP